MRTCWFLRPVPSTVILSGKFGDCVQMTGAFHEISQRTGYPVNVVCSEEYGSVFDGCSFVNAIPVTASWTDTAKLKAVAESQFGGGTVLQFWQDPESPEFQNKRGGISLQIHGKHFRVDTAIDPHYSASMFRRAGFSWAEAINLRPVFDRRDPVREADLLNRCWPKRDKPMLLVTFSGQSSPWGYLPEAYPVISPLLKHFHVVDLGKLKAVRVFDMLALFEHAAGLITVDTLVLHLVAATDLPYVAFRQNGWLGSVPKGNCVLRIPYAQTIRRLPEVLAVLQSWQLERAKNLLVPQIG